MSPHPPTLHYLPALTLLLLLSHPTPAAPTCRKLKSFSICEIPIDIPPLPFDHASPFDRNFSSPSVLSVHRQLPALSSFTPTIIGTHTPSHRNAIDYCMRLAASNWISSVPVTVRVNFSDIGDSLILGQGQPTRNWIVNDFICPVALAEAVVGEELNAAYTGNAQFDILMTLNTQADWYTGLDARPPSGQFDLVTVCLHEVYHGLFMSGGNIGISLSPVDLSYSAIFVRESVTGRFDAFMANQDGCNITAYKDDPRSLGTVLTGNNLWFVSESKRVARLYAPRPFLVGSSLYHLSEADYGAGDGSNNDLMTPAIGSNYGQHNPGPIMTQMQTLVLNVEGKVGADQCEVVNPPEVDDTQIEQGTGNEGESGRENEGVGEGGFSFQIGDRTVNGWAVVGGAAGGLVAVLVVGLAARGVVSARRRNARQRAQPRRRVDAAMNIADGHNGGGVV